MKVLFCYKQAFKYEEETEVYVETMTKIVEVEKPIDVLTMVDHFFDLPSAAHAENKRVKDYLKKTSHRKPKFKPPMFEVLNMRKLLWYLPKNGRPTW